MSVQERIIAVLREPNTSRINFRHAGVPVYGSGFQTMATAIERGTIQVRLPDMNNQRLAAALHETGGAMYSHSTNTLTVASPTFLSDGLAHNKALVVHEMTHALTDYHGEQLSTLVSETCAYIAQMMYVRVNDLDIDGFLNPVHDFRLKNIFQIAWAIACLLYTSPSPRDATLSRMPSSA